MLNQSRRTPVFDANWSFIDQRKTVSGSLFNGAHYVALSFMVKRQTDRHPGSGISDARSTGSSGLYKNMAIMPATYMISPNRPEVTNMEL